MSTSSGPHCDGDGQPIALGDHVRGQLRNGRVVAGYVVSLRKGDIVVVHNESEGRKRSGKSRHFVRR